MVKNINYVKLKNCVVDEISIRKNTTDVDLTPTKDIWQLDSYLIAKFLGNFDAGNLGSNGLPITEFKIKRRRVDSFNVVVIALIPRAENNLSFLDKSARSGVTYEYEVIPLSNQIEGMGYTVQIKCEFDYWWLSNVDDDETYPFMANLEVSEISTNTQRHTYEGFNQFPTVAYGDQQYQSGSITAILLDTLFETSFNYRKRVENFVNNRKQKLLKSPEGDLWMVDTHSSRRKPMTELAQNNISILTFEYTEVDRNEE